MYEIAQLTRSGDPSALPSACKIPQRSLLAIRGLEQEIEGHLQAIIDLKRKINAHLPISSLPVEILCRIFYFTQDTDATRDTQPWGRASWRNPAEEIAWTVVTRVCHLWRDAAINEPSLWTNPTLYYKGWMNAMLDRSLMANVAIRVDKLRPNNELDVIPVIVRHMSHIATLVVTVNTRSSFLRRLVEALTGINAPQLQHLSLRYENAEYSGIGQLLATEQVNKDSLLKTSFLGAVKLRHLELSAVDIDWNSHLFSDLTVLVLEDVSYDSRPSASQFRSILERIPKLTSLTLRKALPTTTRREGASLANNRRIPLSSLMSLVIEAEATEHEFFFNNVALSQSLKSIKGNVLYEDNSELTFQSLVSAAKYAAALDNIEITAKCMYIGGQMTEIFCPWLIVQTAGSFSDRTQTTAMRSRPNPPQLADHSGLRLEVHKQQWEQVKKAQICNELISSLFTEINWFNLCELDLCDLAVDMTLFSYVLAGTFGTLPNIHTIVTGRMSANSVIGALLLGLDDPSHSLDPIAFPSLRHLKLQEVTFGDDSVYLDELQNCLLSRSERGVAIQKLTLWLCRRLGTDNVRALRDIVADIDYQQEPIYAGDDFDFINESRPVYAD